MNKTKKYIRKKNKSPRKKSIKHKQNKTKSPRKRALMRKKYDGFSTNFIPTPPHTTILPEPTALLLHNTVADVAVSFNDLFSGTVFDNSRRFINIVIRMRDSNTTILSTDIDVTFAADMHDGKLYSYTDDSGNRRTFTSRDVVTFEL